MLNYLGMPVAASSHAGEIDQMIVLVHWLMLVLFVGWGAFFVFVLVRFRARRQPEGELRRAPRARCRSASKSRVAIIEVVLLVVLRDSRVGDARASSSRRRARRSSCASSASSSPGTFTIPGADGRFGRTDIKLVSRRQPARPRSHGSRTRRTTSPTINQLNVPVNRPVLVHLSSKDVIHSFGLYEMRVKQDAIPGLRDSGLVHPTVTTARCAERQADFDYEIACSQLCGLGHYRMRGFVNVQSDADYDSVDGRSGQRAREVTIPVASGCSRTPPSA